MFDVEFVVPVCSRLGYRISDFKRYGLVNTQGRSVLLTLLVSNESIDGLDSGWPGGLSVRVDRRNSSNFVGNLYRYYADLDPSNLQARWLVRVDDDSCTDVGGLVANLDSFFDESCPRHLGDLNSFGAARAGGEQLAYNEYRSFLGAYDCFVDLMQNEVECGIMSASAVAKMLKNEPSLALLKKRSEISGGFGDCLVAIASAMAGVWPVNCPFVTRLPLIHEFSLLGGLKNHIHRVCRSPQGNTPWGQSSYESFVLLTKVLDSSPNAVESSLIGRRFLIEDAESVRLIEFMKGYKARSKTERNLMNWYEERNQVLILREGSVIERFFVEDSGRLGLEGHTIVEI